MKTIIAYLTFVLVVISTLFININIGKAPNWILENLILIECILIGGFGGLVYLFRSIYIHRCVKNNWQKQWHTWYYLRPLVSMMSGGIAWLFLKAGILVLDAQQTINSTYYGYFALSLVAGYNVDNFLRRIEEIVKSIWGIEKTRANRDKEDN